MPYLTNLADIARGAGLRVIEQPGWRTRGHGPQTGVKTIVCHHTAGPPHGNAPSLGVVTHGRPGLPGPLSHYVLARDGTVYVIAAGQCWHTGPARTPAHSNPWAIGIEAEATGHNTWPPVQLDAYARLCRALCTAFTLGTDRVRGHKEICHPPGRKTDPNLDMDAFRARPAASGGGSAPPTPAPTTDDEDDEMSFYPKTQPANSGAGRDTLPWDGRAGVLNIIGTGSIVFMSKPLCLGPQGRCRRRRFGCRGRQPLPRRDQPARRLRHPGGHHPRLLRVLLCDPALRVDHGGPMMTKLREYTKAVLAALGGLTPGLVIGVLTLADVTIDADTATLVVALASPFLAALGVAVGPANTPKPPAHTTDTPARLANTWLH